MKGGGPSRLEMLRAARLFKSFQGRAPKGDELAVLDGGALVGVKVGTARQIVYKRLKDGEQYKHLFKNKFPDLYVTADGRQAFLLFGDFRFTRRGFVEKGQ